MADHFSLIFRFVRVFALLFPVRVTRVNPAAGDSPLWLSSPSHMGGGNGLNITQELVDAYKMKDGREINNSSSAFPCPDAATGQCKDFSFYDPLFYGFSPLPPESIRLILSFQITGFAEPAL